VHWRWQELAATGANYGPGMALGVCPYPYVLPLEANHNTVDHDEEDEGDGEDAMAARVQGYRGRAEDRQFHPEPDERNGDRGAANSAQRTAAHNGAPIPSAVLVTGPPPVCTPQ
jgi:hypothetical protein